MDDAERVADGFERSADDGFVDPLINLLTAEHLDEDDDIRCVSLQGVAASML